MSAVPRPRITRPIEPEQRAHVHVEPPPPTTLDDVIADLRRIVERAEERLRQSRALREVEGHVHISTEIH